MCGIVGSITKKDVPFARMLESIRHRGPDDGGMITKHWNDYRVILGHQRLSIIDLSHAGHQPMTNQAGSLCVSYNGEIYNFQEIRTELVHRGYTFRSKTDTEVILHAYHAWGEDCVRRFNGMFAFALWDDRAKKLILSRDHAGQKPLYYALLSDGGIIFSSEVKAILASRLIVPEVNRDCLPEYFATLRVHAPFTLFKNIFKLEPAHTLVWRSSKTEKYPYWDPFDSTSERSTLGDSDAIEELDSLLKKVVKRHMIADVPVGAFLSGGLDSSLIVKLAHEGASSRLSTFTIGFEEIDRKREGAAKNELDYARELQSSLSRSIDYHEIIIRSDVLDILNTVVWHLDEPIADPSAMSAYLLCKEARSHGITVLLSGMGGDEIFGGYHHYLLARYLALIDRSRIPSSLLFALLFRISAFIPSRIRFPGSNIVNYIRRKGAFLCEQGDNKYVGITSWHSREDLANLFPHTENNSIAITSLLEAKQRFFENCPSDDIVTKLMYVDFMTFLGDHNLLYMDKMGMASSCEIRSPYLDREVIEFAFQLPPRLKIKKAKTKYILKKVAERHIPKSIVWQRKSGFSAPIRAWNEKLFETAQNILFSDSMKNEEYFNMETVKALTTRRQSEHVDHSYLLWSFIVFGVWHDMFIKKRL